MNRSFAVLAFLLPLLQTGCEKAPAKSAAKIDAKPPAIPVSVALSSRQDVDVRVSAIGWVEPLATVTVRPQVDAELVSIHFEEGDEVRQGQLLFKLDARSYEAQLHLAEANLKRDQVIALDARREADRLSSLYATNQASSRERDESIADAEAKEAQIGADQAEVERTRLQVERCTILSPVTGRAGSHLVHRGNITKENETALVIINEIAPIYVTFSIPEYHLAEIRSQGESLPVHVEIPNVGVVDEPGKLSFLDNEVDRTTGMVRAKAIFPNTNRQLWPGQFVRVQLTTNRLPQVVVTDTMAVQAGQSGSFVFVVDAEKKVEMRPVVTGIRVDDKTVIVKGLDANELVVSDGHLRLAPGATVEFKNNPSTTEVRAVDAEMTDDCAGSSPEIDDNMNAADTAESKVDGR